MADKVIMVDTSILIDFYRKTDKTNSVWIELIRQGYKFSISAITKYEIFCGATQGQLEFWNNVLKAITVIPFDESTERGRRSGSATRGNLKQSSAKDLPESFRSRSG